MSRNPRRRFPMLPTASPQHRSRYTGLTPGARDWPLQSLDTVEHLLPQQVMALLPEWLLRSVRRDSFTDSPVLAVEKLGSLPRPLGDADKDILVGAVLTLSSSLHLALGLLQGVLPQEKSQERLGEVLCPTLGHLLASVQNTLTSFEPKSPQRAHGAPRPPLAARGGTIPRPVLARDARQALSRPASSPAATTRARQLQSEPWASAERFPSLEDNSAARRLHVEVDIQSRPETQLVKALQAEMRVQAAIHVAIESLEFAEGQLKVVKEVNQLHGGGKWKAPASGLDDDPQSRHPALINA